MGLFKKKEELSFWQKIKLVTKVTKAIKEIKQVLKENSKLSKDLQVAITNLKGDIQVFSQLLPSCHSVVNEILAIIKF